MYVCYIMLLCSPTKYIQLYALMYNSAQYKIKIDQAKKMLEDSTVTVKSRTTIKDLFLYF